MAGLEEVYWASEGRASLDAIVLATVFAIVVMLGIRRLGLDDPGDKLLATAAVGGLSGSPRSRS